jgi:hypothetical protein
VFQKLDVSIPKRRGYTYCVGSTGKTENVTFKLISGILNSLNQKMLIGGIFYDLEKAFDCVSHEILLNKLRYYGIKDKQHNLYKSHLQDRFQRTTICNGLKNSKVYSGWTKVTNGVPQGSILGSLLFIIYINDLPKILEAKSMPILFADDASVLISHSNPIKFKNTINSVYGLLDDRFKKNSISLYTIGGLGAIIRSANYTRFLGLTIEYSVTWERHIDEVINYI